MGDRPELPPFVPYAAARGASAPRFMHVEKISARARKYNWELTPHRHQDLFQVFLIARGRGQVSFDVQNIAYEAPALIAVPPLAIHKLAFAPGIQGLFLTIAESFIADLAALSAEPSIEAVMRVPAVYALRETSQQWKAILAAFEVLFAQYPEGARGRATILTANVMTIMGILLHQGGDTIQSGNADPRTRDLYDRFRALVEQAFREQRPVRIYARELGVGERTLQRACLLVAGVPPLKVIHRRIVIEAQRNLLYTNMSIAEVAYALGFDDPSRFSRLFTDNTGESPLSFRRSRLGA